MFNEPVKSKAEMIMFGFGDYLIAISHVAGIKFSVTSENVLQADEIYLVGGHTIDVTKYTEEVRITVANRFLN